MSKHSIVGLFSAALALGAPFAHAQLGPPPAKLDLIKVRDDIYVISNVAVPGLTTALITNEGVLLVDDKFDADHSGGNAKLQAEGTLAVVQAALDGLINEFK